MKRANSDISAFVKRAQQTLDNFSDTTAMARPGVKSMGQGNTYYSLNGLGNDDEEEEEEDEEDDNNNTSPEINIVDDFFVVDTLRKNQKQQRNATVRRYDTENRATGRKLKALYQEEEDEEEARLTKLQILSRDPLIRFWRLVAGALQMDLEDLFIHEQIERSIERHHRERLSGKEASKQRAFLQHNTDTWQEKYNELTRNEYPRLTAVRQIVEELTRVTGRYDADAVGAGYFDLLVITDDYARVFGESIDTAPDEKTAATRKRWIIALLERHASKAMLPENTASLQYDELYDFTTFLLMYSIVDYNSTSALRAVTRQRIVDYDSGDTLSRQYAAAEKQTRELLPVPTESVMLNRGLENSGCDEEYQALITQLIAVKGDQVKTQKCIGPRNIETMHANDALREKLKTTTTTEAKIGVIREHYIDQYRNTVPLYAQYRDAKENGQNESYVTIREQLYKPIVADLLYVYLGRYDTFIAALVHTFMTVYTGHTSQKIAPASVLNLNIVSTLIDVYTRETDIPARTQQTKVKSEPTNAPSSTARSSTTTETIPVFVVPPSLNPRDLIRDPVFIDFYLHASSAFDALANDRRAHTLPLVKTRFGGVATPALAPYVTVASVCRVLIDYVTFVPLYIEYTARRLESLNEQIMRLTRNLTGASERPGLGAAEEEEEEEEDEEYATIDARYHQKRVKRVNRDNMAPLVSGIIEVSDRIQGKLDEAVSLIHQHCPTLRKMPLAGFQSTSAIEQGLAGHFANYVAVLYADANLLNPDAYKSKLNHDKVTMKKIELMLRFKRYAFSVYSRRGARIYTIRVIQKPV